MLIDIETGREIDRVAYQGRFELLRKRLSDGEFEGIVAAINALIDDAGGEIATAGWLPGSDWSDGPFEVIYLTHPLVSHGIMHPARDARRTC